MAAPLAGHAAEAVVHFHSVVCDATAPEGFRLVSLTSEQVLHIIYFIPITLLIAHSSSYSFTLRNTHLHVIVYTYIRIIREFKCTLHHVAQEERIDAYRAAMRVARDSTVANPRFSNYYCREGICRVMAPGQAPSKVAAAGNVEYGYLQALHGEEAAIVAGRSNMLWQDPLAPVVLGDF